MFDWTIVILKWYIERKVCVYKLHLFARFEFFNSKSFVNKKLPNHQLLRSGSRNSLLFSLQFIDWIQLLKKDAVLLLDQLWHFLKSFTIYILKPTLAHSSQLEDRGPSHRPRGSHKWILFPINYKHSVHY